MTREQQIIALAYFLEALDEWTLPFYEEQAKEILDFIDSGFDLSEYREED